MLALQMFGKSDLVDDLNRDLCRARDKHDALAFDVTTLSAQIAELEARLAANGFAFVPHTYRFLGRQN